MTNTAVTNTAVTMPPLVRHPRRAGERGGLVVVDPGQIHGRV